MMKCRGLIDIYEQSAYLSCYINNGTTAFNDYWSANTDSPYEEGALYALF